MKVNLFGLGYVGSVTSICLSSIGHQVTGIELMPAKVEALNQGRLPIYEPGLEDLFQSVLQKKSLGSFRAVQEITADSCEAEISIVCVGTPSTNRGEVDLGQIRETTATLGRILAKKKTHHTVIFRSTVPAGTTETLLVPLLEAESGKKAGVDFSFCFYPEFLREGQAIKDFFSPSLNIVGTTDDRVLETVEALFKVDKKAVKAAVKTSEMIKYANNSFHALKVSFANEIGTLCREYGVDSAELADLFVSDKTLNISPHYLRPGFAFGGSCLPKELRSISALARAKGVNMPLLESILDSNAEQVERLVAMIENEAVEKIGFFGVTFKPNTDDVRESPILEVIERLSRPTRSYKKPMTVFVHDQQIVREKVQKMFGERIQAIANAADLVARSEMIVLGPLALDSTTAERLLAYEGVIIDLKWHAVRPQLRTLQGFKEIC